MPQPTAYSARLWVAATVLAVSLTTSADPAHATEDLYLCYGARLTTRALPAQGLELRDRLAGARSVDARRPKGLCAPATVGAGAPNDPDTFLERYHARLTRTQPRQPRIRMPDQAVSGPLGPSTVRLTRALQLLVPTHLGDAGSSAAPDSAPHFQCYGARAISPLARLRLPLADRFGQRQYDIGKPTRLCLRTDKNGEDPEALADGKDIMCHRVRLARTRPRQPRHRSRTLDTINQIAAERLRLGASREVCFPVTTLTLPGATASPTPVPEPTPTVGGATLERITIRPPEIARLPSEVKHFWATGHFSNGATRDITNEVVWATGDQTVATATNDPNDPNLVELHEAGTTYVSATDPVTGVSTDTSGDNAILHVTGPLSSIRVHPRYGRVFEDGFEQFTAVGCYRPTPDEPGCVYRNITQDVTWLTSVDRIADAANPEGDRSRIVGRRPGLTGVHALDPATGITSGICSDPLGSYCGGAVLAVLGDLESIELVTTGPPRRFFRLPVGARARLAAIGHYEGGGFRHVTQESVLHSSDENVFVTPNLAGDRGRFEVVGGGDATLSVLHPATGVVSPPFPHFAFGNIVDIRVLNWHADPVARPLGRVFPFTCCEYAKGVYPDGRLGPLFDWTLTVDDPTIARVEGISLVGLRLGTVSVAMRDIPTGIESRRKLVTFFGDLNRLELSPPAVELRVGDDDQLTAILDYDGSYQEVVTQRAEYTSSEPSVVEAPNEIAWPRRRSRIVARAPGEAVISATSGDISSGDSGDNTFVTVVGDLVSLTITPSVDFTGIDRSQQFTATGTDAAGRTINLTQVVTWSTSDTDIAEATNTDGDKSRIHGRDTGTVTVHAVDPVTGLSSTASGGDATLTVRNRVRSLLLLPESLPLLAGTDYQLTTLGITADGTLNITQEVDYESDDPSVVAVTSTEEDRSRITAIGPGTARITAEDPITGRLSNETVVTVTDPGQ